MFVPFMPITDLPPGTVRVAMALLRPGATPYYLWGSNTWGAFGAAALQTFPADPGVPPNDFYYVTLADSIMEEADTIIQLLALDADGAVIKTVRVESVNIHVGQ